MALKKFIITLTPLLICFVYGFILFYHGMPGQFSTATVMRGDDAEIFVWSIYWWSHALYHGINPFYIPFLQSHGQWLQNMTSVPFYSILFAPLTHYFGAVLTYNISTLLAFSLTAWSMYLLLKHWCGSLFWAWLGCWCLMNSGFYWLHFTDAHLNLSSLFPIILLMYGFMQHYCQRWSARKWVIISAILLAVQYGLSRELLIFTLLGVIIISLVALIQKEPWRDVLRYLGGIGVAGLIAMVIVSPLLWDSLHHGLILTASANIVQAHIPGFFLPSRYFALHTLIPYHTDHYGSHEAYFGVPMYGLLLLSWYHYWRSDRIIAILGVVIIIMLIFSFGYWINVAPYDDYPLPWAIAAYIPILQTMGPSRWLVFVDILIILSVTRFMILIHWRRTTQIIWAALLVISLFPSSYFLNHLVYPDNTLPAFFQHKTYLQVIGPQDRVLTYAPNGSTRDLLKIARLVPTPFHQVYLYTGPLEKGWSFNYQFKWQKKLATKLNSTIFKCMLVRNRPTLVLLPSNIVALQQKVFAIMGTPKHLSGYDYWRLSAAFINSLGTVHDLCFKKHFRINW
jgi:hypothetical protein